MPPRTLDSLAHALSAAHDLDAALVALGEGLAEIERSAMIGLIRHDPRTNLLTELRTPVGPHVEKTPLEVAFAHLPKGLATRISAGAEFVDTGDQAPDFVSLLSLRPGEGAQIAVKGVLLGGELTALVVCAEARRIFGTRVAERFAPAVSMFELAYARFSEIEARLEAVHALEDVTRRMHTEYMSKLARVEGELVQARGAGTATPTSVVTERVQARAAEEARRLQQRVRALEQQVVAGTSQLELAHVELHRRSESLRQRSRTLYLLERVLTLAATTEDPKAIADGLLSLVGDDLQAQRCSLFLRAPEPGALYLAASRGLAPYIKHGQRVRVGEGVAGHVAATREPLLVVEPTDAATRPLLGDEYLTTGSFISFPLVLRGELVGVVNVTNRAQRGIFVEEDVERVRLLGLVCAVAASDARLPERLATPATPSSAPAVNG